MNAVAIVLSYGRPELGELLTQWSKQTRPAPLLVWLDGYEGRYLVPKGIHVHRAPRLGANNSIGGVRAAAVELAREIYGLGPMDGFLVLDDDDYYSPTHAEHTIAALERAPHGWTGAARVAYQWRPDMMPPELVHTDGGPGQHAAWGVRLDLYDRSGGYLDSDLAEDVRLAERMGWKTCTTHTHLTHVRRQHGSTLSAHILKAPGTSYDRDRLRRELVAPALLEPTWRPELAELEQWTRENERGPDGV